MITKEVKIITINWYKIPFEETEIQKYDTEKDYGIYQVYGEHYAYGKDSLLYIGLACDQTFKTRLISKYRLDSEFKETTALPKYILLGYISKSTDHSENIDFQERRTDSIKIAEEILIGTHSPAFNKQITKSLWQLGKKFDSDYLIINWGERGSLLPEVSTLRNSYAFYNFEEPLK